MYFPFLRGKQFELIALRELSNFQNLPLDKISVIIEPVKKSFSSLDKTLTELNKNNINFNIIINPIVGDFASNNELIDRLPELLNNFSNYQLCYYLSNNSNIKLINDKLKSYSLSCNGLSFIHTSELDFRPIEKEFNKSYPTVYNILKVDGLSRGYPRNIDQKTRVLLADHFDILQRNSDYLQNTDDFFSDDNLFYDKEGYAGFSDYTVIGDPYLESGFLPYAVAIHITYCDSTNKIRIHHFVSDSNEDTSDVGGKFMEALKKLVDWTSSHNITTQAINSFNELYRNKSFPGLGTIKKLSIINHFEVTLRTI